MLLFIQHLIRRQHLAQLLLHSLPALEAHSICISMVYDELCIEPPDFSQHVVKRCVDPQVDTDLSSDTATITATAAAAAAAAFFLILKPPTPTLYPLWPRSRGFL